MSEEETKPIEETPAAPQEAGKYNAANIQVLEGMEAVRKRPAMYIGDTGERGYHHLVYEVVDNSIDEALAGYCSLIDVQINPDGSLSVTDNGRGIPVDMHPTQHRPAIEVVLTILHAGGKFDGSNYKVSGGLHGVGVSCVNALSDWMKVEVKRGGKIHHIEFSRGHVTKPLEVVGECGDETGTKVTFFPDHSIFSCHAFKWEILCNRLRELAFLNKGVKIHFKDNEGEGHRGPPRGDVPLRGRHRPVHRIPQHEQEAAHARDPLRGRGAGRDGHGAGGGVHAVHGHLLHHRADLLQQHPHHRGRHAPLRLPRRAHAHHQQVRPRDEERHQGEGPSR